MSRDLRPSITIDINTSGDKMESTGFRLTYIPALDGIRGVAVLAVLAFHCGWTRSGYHGVDMFFTLSGFLITCLLIQEWQRTGSIDLKQFYFKRALRLLPALLVVLLAATLYESLFFPYPGVAHVWVRDVMALSYLANWFWALSAPYNPLGSFHHFWSLAIEEQFYLLWPLTIRWLLARGIGLKKIAGFLLIGSAASVAQRYYLWHAGADVSRLYVGTDSHADPILIGCLLGVVIFLVPAGHWQRLSSLSPVCTPAIIAATVFMLISPTPGSILLLGPTITAVLTVMLLILVTVMPPSSAKVLLQRPVLIWVGQLSYGIYLWHGTVTFYFQVHFAMPPATTIAVGVPLAILCYYLVEIPFLRLKKRRQAASLRQEDLVATKTRAVTAGS